MVCDVRTKKVLKAMREAEKELVLLPWKAYWHGDDDTLTWNTREDDKPIDLPVHVPQI